MLAFTNTVLRWIYSLEWRWSRLQAWKDVSQIYLEIRSFFFLCCLKYAELTPYTKSCIGVAYRANCQKNRYTRKMTLCTLNLNFNRSARDSPSKIQYKFDQMKWMRIEEKKKRTNKRQTEDLFAFHIFVRSRFTCECLVAFGSIWRSVSSIQSFNVLFLCHSVFCKG